MTARVLLERLRRSRRLDPALRADVIAYLRARARAESGRATAAAKVSRERSTAIRAGIRRAAGVLPLNLRGVAGVVQRRITLRGPAAFGLALVPCLTTIRAVLARMAAERRSKNQETSEPKLSPTATNQVYRSVVQST